MGKIYKELVAIRTELQLIRKNIPVIEEDLEGIHIKTVCPGGHALLNEVSFSLPCSDWFKLKQSKDWKEIQKQILESKAAMFRPLWYSLDRSVATKEGDE